jgi:hypothetical protein
LYIDFVLLLNFEVFLNTFHLAWKSVWIMANLVTNKILYQRTTWQVMVMDRHPWRCIFSSESLLMSVHQDQVTESSILELIIQGKCQMGSTGACN